MNQGQTNNAQYKGKNWKNCLEKIGWSLSICPLLTVESLICCGGGTSTTSSVSKTQIQMSQSVAANEAFKTHGHCVGICGWGRKFNKVTGPLWNGNSCGHVYTPKMAAAWREYFSALTSAINSWTSGRFWEEGMEQHMG